LCDRGRTTLRLSRRPALALLLSSILISSVKAGEAPSPLIQETNPQKDALLRCDVTLKIHLCHGSSP
jgi:hypothetical protein